MQPFNKEAIKSNRTHGKPNHDSVDQAVFKWFLDERSQKYETTKVVKKW